MKNEVWKPILNYENYLISNYGRIKSLPKKTHTKEEVILKTRIGKCGYEIITFSGANHLTKTFKIHRLVATAFIPNPNNLPCVNHKDENKLNNNVDNLEWCDYKYNNNYGSARERAVLKKSKNIIQKDLNGNIIKEWLNAMEIKRALNFDNSTIHKCCKGKIKKYKNYIWEYIKN